MKSHIGFLMKFAFLVALAASTKTATAGATNVTLFFQGTVTSSVNPAGKPATPLLLPAGSPISGSISYTAGASNTPSAKIANGHVIYDFSGTSTALHNFSFTFGTFSDAYVSGGAFVLDFNSTTKPTVLEIRAATKDNPGLANAFDMTFTNLTLSSPALPTSAASFPSPMNGTLVYDPPLNPEFSGDVSLLGGTTVNVLTTPEPASIGAGVLGLMVAGAMALRRRLV